VAVTLANKLRSAFSRSGDDAPDAELRDRVRDAVAKMDGDVHVEVTDGVVVLRGQVPDWDALEATHDLVAGVRGVNRIESHLHLPATRPPHEPVVIGDA
jgi:osmotically-inducible protein OsmY